MTLTNNQSHFFSSARNHISPAAQIAIDQLAPFNCCISPSPPPKIMNDFPPTPPLLPPPPPPHVVAMGNEIGHGQSPSHEGKAQAAST
jgi:hypothetical protein